MKITPQESVRQRPRDIVHGKFHGTDAESDHRKDKRAAEKEEDKNDFGGNGSAVCLMNAL